MCSNEIVADDISGRLEFKQINRLLSRFEKVIRINHIKEALLHSDQG